MEVIARGIATASVSTGTRKTGELWFTDNGRDWMGEEGPEDELNRVSKVGLDFGFRIATPTASPTRSTRRRAPCKGVTLPVALLGPHARRARHDLLYGEHVPGRVPETHLRRSEGLVEPHEALSAFDVVKRQARSDGRTPR